MLDAGEYIHALPRKQTQDDHWQAAIEVLIMAAEDRGPLMYARVGLLRALNRQVERVFNRIGKIIIGKAKAHAGPSLMRVPVLQFAPGSFPRFLMFNR